MIEVGDPFEEQPLRQRPEQADDHRREEQREPVVQAGVLQQEIRGEGADHVEGAVRKIDDVEHAENHGEAETQQRIERPVDQADQQLPVELLGGDEMAEKSHAALCGWEAAERRANAHRDGERRDLAVIARSTATKPSSRGGRGAIVGG